MGEDAAMGIAIALLAAGGAVMAALGWLGMGARLPMNAWAGIRTPYTKSSERRWTETHRAAGPLLMLGGAAIAAAGLAFFPFVLAGLVPFGLATAVVMALIVLALTFVLGSWLYGTRAARARLGDG